MKKYKDDYEIITTEDGRGGEKREAVYRGDYYEVSLTEYSPIKFKRFCALLFVVIAILHVGIGFINNQGMYQLYIALPYAAAFFPLFYLALGIFNLSVENRKLRRDEVDLSYNRVSTASKSLLVIMGIGIVGEIVYLIFLSSRVERMAEWGFLLPEVLAIIAVYYLVQLQKSIKIEVFGEKKPELKMRAR